LIKDYFAAERNTEVIIPTIQKLGTWDVNIMISHMKKKKYNKQLQLQELQRKSAILLCIATMWRPRSDIGRLQLRDITFKFENNIQSSKPSSVTIHSRQPKEAQIKSIQLGILEDTTICPVLTLFQFKKQTIYVNIFPKTIPSIWDT
jgi:hypothetical protein